MHRDTSTGRFAPQSRRRSSRHRLSDPSPKSHQVHKVCDTPTKILEKWQQMAVPEFARDPDVGITLRDFTQVLQGVTMSPLRPGRNVRFARSRLLLPSMNRIASATRSSCPGETVHVHGFKTACAHAFHDPADQTPRERDPDLHLAQDDLHLPFGDRRLDLLDRHVVAQGEALRPDGGGAGRRPRPHATPTSGTERQRLPIHRTR